jgi:DNA repair exonuclease SbcCD ATPase subunit
MIEMVMFFGLGFFTACLATIFVANAVWRRAVRLTTKRVQSSMPISLSEIKADRDQLRADFAMSTRKLELSVDELKQKMQGQVTEIAKKNEQIRLLLLEAKTKSDTVRDLEQREQNQRFELLKSESELGDTTRRLRETEGKLSLAQNALAERDKALSQSQSLADERRVALSALNTQISQLQQDISHLQRQRDALEVDHATKHDALARTERALADQRAAGKSMGTKLEALDGTVQAQAKEIGQLEAKISEITAQLRAQMAENERTSNKAQNLLAERNKIDEELARRTATAELRLNSFMDDKERISSERASLEGQLNAAREERKRLAEKLKQLETGAHDNWEKERSDNALLRERINDIASEITSLGGAISGDEDSIRKTLTPQSERPQPMNRTGSEASSGLFGRYRADARKDALPGGQVPIQQQTRKTTDPRAQNLNPQGTTSSEAPRKLTLAERMKRLQERSGL